MNDKNSFVPKLLPNVYKIIDSITNLTSKNIIFLSIFSKKILNYQISKIIYV